MDTADHSDVEEVRTESPEAHNDVTSSVEEASVEPAEEESPLAWETLPAWKRMRELIFALQANIELCYPAPNEIQKRRSERLRQSLYLCELQRPAFLHSMLKPDPPLCPDDLTVVSRALAHVGARGRLCSPEIERALYRVRGQAMRVQRRLLMNEFFRHKIMDSWDDDEQRTNNAALIRILEAHLHRLEWIAQGIDRPRKAVRR